MKSKFVFTALLAGILFFSSGISENLRAQDHSYRYSAHSKVEVKKAEKLRMKLTMVAGELNFEGKNMPQLYSGEYLYDDAEYGNPEVKYRVDDKIGRMIVGQGDMEDVEIDIDDEEASCVWNIGLKKDIPQELIIKQGFGEANIDLEGSALKKFIFETKVGKADINLRNTSVPMFSCKAIAGEATIDLTGKWKNDLHAIIKGGVGNLNLKLPSGCNLHVVANGILGNIDAPGLRRRGDTYSQEVSNSRPTLYIDITGGIGNIYLNIEE